MGLRQNQEKQKTLFYEGGSYRPSRQTGGAFASCTQIKDKKMRPVGFEPTFPVLTNLACYSTLLWSLLRRVVSIHRLLSYEPNAIPLCYSVYAPRGEATFENGKNLESIFILNIFLYKTFVFFIQKLNPSALGK